MKNLGVIEIPNALNSEFDHAAFDPRTRRVFIAHTARDCIEVIDNDAQKHIATLPGFPGVAGAVADDGEVLATNRGAASVAWLDGQTYGTKAVFNCGPRPNGAAIVKRTGVAIAACIGDDREGPTLLAVDLNDGSQRVIDLPGRPRWCVTDAAAERVFLCIREPSMLLVARLPDLGRSFIGGCRQVARMALISTTLATVSTPPAMTVRWSKSIPAPARSRMSGRSLVRPT